ncbi:MAG: hypothetical protein PVJ02_12355, partial [Gemmatimonadota bacterium]
MNGYAVALFAHLVSLLLASVAASLAMFAALRLRGAESIADAASWLGVIRRVVRLFPLAVLGLMASGWYMTHERWSFSLPWIDAAVVGLVLIVILGTGVEGSRNRALGRELQAHGLSMQARRLLRDPVAWSAKMSTLTVSLAVVFLMTVKPTGPVCVVTMLA